MPNKWRPNTKSENLYCIPDIHGQHDCLSNLLKRVLPLRKSEGILDHLILLGDYIDRHTDSHKVLDSIIQLKEQFPNQVHCLLGNHELLLLQALEIVESKAPENSYNLWLENGGRQTILGYLHRNKIFDVLPDKIERLAIKELIPTNHLEFLTSTCLPFYWHGDRFCFVHGGINPFVSADEQDVNLLVWDRSLFQYVKKNVVSNQPLGWDHVIVCGHSGPTPFIHDNFMMLDVGSPRSLIMIELNSRTAFQAIPGQGKLVKYPIENTVLKKPYFSKAE